MPRKRTSKRLGVDDVVDSRLQGHTLQDVLGLILSKLGVYADPDADALDLAGTPARVIKSWHTELLAGYGRTEDDLVAQVRLFPAKGRSELVVQTGVAFTSLCAHHMLPFHGTATIGYMPGDKLIGLSKFARILDHYAARLQIQERLGGQVADFIVDRCSAKWAAVVLHAEHQCMTCRGVRRPGAMTATSSIRPHDIDRELLNEFYALANLSR
jgi:GTP cyclohydrolase IA